jgi:protein-L-isoaspartate(D-aspartate) O-methyltransferase
VSRLREMGISSEEVLELIRTTPRHLFVDEALASRAYENTALPIGFGQTISQPYIVAAMTEYLIKTGPIDKVLEIGAGSGYQTVILSQLAKKVFSVERIAALVDKLRPRIRDLRINNVRIKHDDGFSGWPVFGPYDAILVAAAPVQVPTDLLGQLAIAGRLVIPIGPSGAQKLRVFKRTQRGIEESTLERVSFVPLVDGTN